ncbi:MAG: carboxypeptidase-like regulatory domain-containing protein [Acidobacteriota bacterium]
MKKIFLIILIALISSLSALAQESGGVKGRIRSMQGSILTDVKVTLNQDDKNIKTTNTDKRGEFQFNGLKAGKYSFTFTKSGFVQGTLNNVEIKKNKIRDLGDKLALDIDQGTLVIIEGSVFNEDGRSIYGAIIDIARVYENGSTKKLKTISSSESGQFTFRFTEGTATF